MRTLLVMLSMMAGVPAPGWEHPGYDAEDSYYNPAESTINAGTIAALAPPLVGPPLRTREGACGGPSAPLLTGAG